MARPLDPKLIPIKTNSIPIEKMKEFDEFVSQLSTKELLALHSRVADEVNDRLGD